MTPTAIAGLNEVLLLAALRAERKHSDSSADQRAKEAAKRWDERAEQARCIG